MAPNTSRKEAVWLACKEKTCCYTSFVLVTGRDVWSIASALDAPPWSFLVYFQSPEPKPDAFVLDNSDRYFRLALAKQPSRRKKSPPPCIFLLKTRNGYHRCGLGALRPGVCKSFPSELVSGVLCVQNNRGCTCRRWALADVEIEEETALVRAQQRDYAEYAQVVASWNALIAGAPPDAEITFFDYCEYLMEAYGEIRSQKSEMPNLTSDF